MMGLVGLGPLMAATQKPLAVRIVNPVAVLGRNAVAESYTQNETTTLHYFGGADLLKFGETPYAHLGFRPQFAQFMTGFKFVYLNPK
jgi:hypothetical protein